MFEGSASLYIKYERKMERQMLFKLVAEKFEIRKALYPGSYIHISPSFYIPEVVYVDTDKRANTFFTDTSFGKIIEKNKTYNEETTYRFSPSDFRKDILEKEGYFDLLISQYAGFISQYCKKYLKPHGILLANNSHGDAGVANIDKDYKLIAVINYRNKKFYYSEKNLDLYFIPRKENIKQSMKYLKSLRKGISYVKTASHYLFRKA